MEIGQKIKQLRYKAGLTQEQLGERLGLSAQAVSKWETAVTMPDISLLPALAETFGVSIDELFDLSREQKLRRLESRLEQEEMPPDVFREYEELLQEELSRPEGREHCLSLLAQLYHHRMEADARRVSRYAREAMRLSPGKKDCQWLLGRAEGAVTWDWNLSNHAGVIDFFKELVASAPGTPLPYYYLLDNLIADHRTAEAEETLRAYCALPEHRPFLAAVFRAHIQLAKYNESAADAIMEEAMGQFGENAGFLFEAAQYHAKKCEYAEALACYEASYAKAAEHKPRFVDALEGIAKIYEITGDARKAADTWDRILDNLRLEWGLTDELSVQDALREKNRLLQKL